MIKRRTLPPPRPRRRSGQPLQVTILRPPAFGSKFAKPFRKLACLAVPPPGQWPGFRLVRPVWVGSGPLMFRRPLLQNRSPKISARASDASRVEGWFGIRVVLSGYLLIHATPPGPVAGCGLGDAFAPAHPHLVPGDVRPAPRRWRDKRAHGSQIPELPDFLSNLLRNAAELCAERDKDGKKPRSFLIAAFLVTISHLAHS